jgi:hypothetical protein
MHDLAAVHESLRRRDPDESEGRTVDELRECARRCLACAGSCLTAVAERLDREEPLPSHLTVLLGCAELCELTARSIVRGSSEASKIAQLCADVCDDTIAVAVGEPELAATAEVARICARACRQLVAEPA